MHTQTVLTGIYPPDSAVSEMSKKCICLRKSTGDCKAGHRRICLWTILRMQHMWKLRIWTWILLKCPVDSKKSSCTPTPPKDTCHSLKTLTNAVVNTKHCLWAMESVEICVVNLRAFLGRGKAAQTPKMGLFLLPTDHHARASRPSALWNILDEQGASVCVPFRVLCP